MLTRVDLKQLAQAGATTGQAPVWDGTKWAPATVSSGGGGGGAELAADGVVDALKALSSADTRVRGPFTRNYISNPDAEIDTTGWATYADAAGVQPVDGTGGSPAVTWTRSVASPLAGAGSFLLTKDAANRQGQGAGIPFTIQREDCGKSLSLSGNVAVNSGTYTPGEISLWVLDVTASKLCPISSGNTVQAGGSFAIQFTSSSSTSYRLIVHIGGTSVLAYTVLFDDFYIGAVYLPGMPAMSDDQSYVPAIAGMGTVTGLQASWRRVGNRLQLACRFVCGTPTASLFQLPLPNGLTVDPAVYPSGSTSLVGRGVRNNTAAANGFTILAVADGRTYLTASVDSFSGVNAMTSANGNGLCNTGEIFTCFAEVAIQGWAGSTAVQSGSRYLWAQKFAGVATRVTTTPSKSGEYRFRLNTVDSAPSSLPSAANGFYFYFTTGLTQLDIYIGPGKTQELQAFLSAGRTGIIYDLPFNNGTNWFGLFRSYDPATGVLSITAANSVGMNATLGAGVTTCYLDILVADDPVPVAMANQESALSEWQSYTPTITNCGTVTANTAEWRRVGEELEVRGSFTTGTNAASPATLSLPTGLVVGSLGGTGADTQIVGVFGLGSSSGGNPRCVLAAAGDTTVGFGIIAASVNATTKQNGSALFNTSERESYSFKVKVVGWSATQVVQLGSRYRWAERYAATATRVAGPPSRLGEYRARRAGTDTAPTTGPTVADGIRIDAGSGIAAGRINQYDIYVGPGKVVHLSPHLSAGRTGFVSADLFTSGSDYRGINWSYDPTAGIVSAFCRVATAGDRAGVAFDASATYGTVYFDLLIADDPVPVAQADQLSALTDWTDGGATAVTAVTTPPTKGTIVRDKVWYRRVGDSAEIRVEFEQSSAGTAGSGDYLFTLPNGLMFDSAEVEFFTGAVAASPRYDRGVGICTQTTVNVETSVVPYDATRFRIRGHAFDNSGDAFIASGFHGFSNTVLRLSVQFAAPILGWSGTQAVQLGSRYLWSERFAASATRVTAPPSGPGQYRAQIRTGGSATFTDNAPSTAPSATDGFRLFASATYGTSDTSGQPSRFVIYVGPRKIVNVVAYKSAGRTGFAASLGLAGSAFYYGYVWNYDPTAGTVTVEVPPISSATSGLAVGVDETYAVLSSIYFDLVVADDPVPVAMAPSVHVEASSDAGQACTADVTNLQYEDEVVDTHGAWSGSVFTCPVAGVYSVRAGSCDNAAVSIRLDVWKNGSRYISGVTSIGGQRTIVVANLKLVAGDTVSIRAAPGTTRTTTAFDNGISITRIGDA
ncbi:MAG TPA: hypothetical protein PLS53_00020 [Thermoanaerobaculaceae bacterium]|nr:hypothetical protein [Thermoanaerobaculaceae bacterium]